MVVVVHHLVAPPAGMAPPRPQRAPWRLGPTELHHAAPAADPVVLGGRGHERLALLRSRQHLGPVRGGQCRARPDLLVRGSAGRVGADTSSSSPGTWTGRRTTWRWRIPGTAPPTSRSTRSVPRRR